MGSVSTVLATSVVISSVVRRAVRGTPFLVDVDSDGDGEVWWGYSGAGAQTG